MIASSALGLLLCTMTRARDDDNIFDMRVSWLAARARHLGSCVYGADASDFSPNARTAHLCSMRAGITRREVRAANCRGMNIRVNINTGGASASGKFWTS